MQNCMLNHAQTKNVINSKTTFCIFFLQAFTAWHKLLMLSYDSLVRVIWGVIRAKANAVC